VERKLQLNVNIIFKELATVKIEIDDLLENYINITEEITESNYLQMKGHFFRLIMSQNGSRILQKCVAKTPRHIITQIFYEVNISF